MAPYTDHVLLYSSVDHVPQTSLLAMFTDTTFCETVLQHFTFLLTEAHYYTLSSIINRGHLRGLVGNGLDHRSQSPEFESWHGHI